MIADDRRVGKGVLRAVPTTWISNRIAQIGGHASLCPPYDSCADRNDRSGRSAPVGRNIPDTRRMRGDIVETVGQMNALVRWRSLFDR